MKKKFIFSTVIALATVLVMNFSLCYAFAGTSSNDSSSSKPIYLALGDSITYGYEPGDTAQGKQLTDECFVSILAKDKGYTALNEGVIGNTAAGVLKQLNTGEFDSTIKNASIITLTCGGNDLMEVLYQKTADYLNSSKAVVKKWGKFTSLDVITILALSSIYPDKYPTTEVTTVQLALMTVLSTGDLDQSTEFQTALSEFIDTLNQVTSTIKRKNPDVKIFVSTQYNPYEHCTSTLKSLGTTLGKCASILRQKVVDNASTGQYTVADVYSAFEGNTATYCNASENPLQIDFHPSVAGHAAIAKCFEEVVPDASEVTPPTPDDGSDSDSKDDGSKGNDSDSENSSHKTAKSTSDSNSASDDTNAPDTGDDANLWLPLAAMTVSTIALTGIVVARRKRERKAN